MIMEAYNFIKASPCKCHGIPITMALQKIICNAFFIFIFLYIIASNEAAEFSRRAFPSNFLFGVAASAYQYEGAYVEDGKGLSNWDVFSHIPGNIDDGKNGDIAIDQYHRYKEDVEIMSEMGVEVYRFSIAWSRIFPNGSGEINPKGVRYYNDLINELLSKGIEPFVTLCHYDLPQALEDQYGSWLNPRIVDDFVQYAEACFRMFGDRVKYWVTFNEPNVFIPVGYETGGYPPDRCSPSSGNCSAGNSSTEPYIAGHNLLRAHASTVDAYRRQYQNDQGGFIGIIISAIWFEPLRNIPEDFEAAERIHAFHNAWFVDPIVYGEYPAIMLKLLGKRLPIITEELHHKLRGSFDFIGLNYYSSYYATDDSQFPHRNSLTALTDKRNGVPIGPQMYPTTMTGVPYGIEKIVNYMKVRYSNPPLFISENGFGDQRNDNLPLIQMLNDTFRVDFIKNALKYLVKATREGADVRGYFVWSLVDNFEWAYGYTSKFGVYHVDFNDGLQRFPKLSAFWYRNFLQGKSSGYKEDFLRECMEKHTHNANHFIAKI